MRTNIKTTPFGPRDLAAFNYGLALADEPAHRIGGTCLTAAQGGLIRATIDDALLALDGPMGWRALRTHDDPPRLAGWLRRALDEQAADGLRWAAGVIRDLAETAPGWEACDGPETFAHRAPNETIALDLAIDSTEILAVHRRSNRGISLWRAWTADEPLSRWLAKRMGSDEGEEAAA